MDIFDKMEKVPKVPTVKKRSKLSSFRFEVKETDSELLVLAKETVNEKEITSSDLFNIVGSRDITVNMVNSMRHASTINWDKFKIWMELAGMEVELLITQKEQSKK